ncbi:MAG: helix-turn-helix domain-containing protein, partial [Eubacterium sp.]|nr:helix-turn-helix domain-containing protein [Eubacterium sp.]
LENDGLVVRTEYPQVPPKVEYSLTDKGKSLIPMLTALCTWGEAHKK